MSDNLDSIRKKLDEIDRTILQALAQRQGLVKEVSEFKLKNEKGIRDLEREEQLLNRIRDLAHEVGLDRYYAEHLFREIITNSVRFQTHSLVDHQNEQVNGDRIRVSYQGTDGAYSHLAATRHFSERFSQVDAIGYNTFQKAAEALMDEKVDYAILPIENTTAGAINDTYDIVGNENIHIVGEEILKVVHCLLAIEPVDISKIRRILSHPQAIAQSSEFLSRVPRARVESYIDTAISAKKILEDGDITQAAIAGAHTADLYGLHVIEHDIANQRENYTRFVIASKTPVKVDPQIPAKTSLMMVTSNDEGSLIECLNVLHKHKINMSKLESRPRLNEPWRYSFYLDILGNVDDEEVARGLEELKDKAEELKILGCYPKEETGNDR
ncbi:bifunctional chorismate mutase/prephenate dehydratase [Gracilimonas mengyeensis]|uniref:Bifunctional chorismate mutase/prephenate dehydratase n=1 Tax=Gracilimonas mengyeensis TaxID=1302730 RepID=A0A521C204_9BACT|nr:prephenate dehydratase domain-containing protein [Gracilimonas mengyeensis]SMO53365.1 chorismate mutase / prephenate dehydratase [Gracilimonas mengyeensis]